MKILVLHGHLSMGGEERVLLNVLRNLIELCSTNSSYYYIDYRHHLSIFCFYNLIRCLCNMLNIRYLIPNT